MKLLVLAQTPPPVHGQSLMVRTLVEGLPRIAPDIEIFHVNLPLSRGTADIGRWRAGKLLTLLRACREAVRLRRIHGPMMLYYVPAPAKLGAALRDWIAMRFCRRHFSHLILHWHAVGLGSRALTRIPARTCLDRASLSLVLSPALAPDILPFRARETLCVPNGIPDPGPPALRAHRPSDAPCELLFLGLCTETKGLFELLDALELALARHPDGFHLTVAGGFASRREEDRFRQRAARLGGTVTHAGFADEAAKRELFARADVFCFPTHYPHEGQPLVVIEALAHDIPIVATKWRAIPGMLPATHTWLVEPHRPAQLCTALCAARQSPRPDGALREYFLANYTVDHHLQTLATALRTLA